MKLIFSLNEKTHGPGPIDFLWQNSGTYIATTGYDNTVNIYDRHGELIDQIGLPGTCTSLSWDKDGDILAVTNNKSNVIVLWDVNTRKTTQLDSSMGFKDILTFAEWSRTTPVLAVGNSKGNLLLYNHQTSRKVPVIGKHTRKITCGSFSNNDLLALGAEDQQITVSNLDGDTLYSFACNADPAMIQFAEMKQSERVNSGDNTVSAVIGKRILMMVNLNEAENPINLQFQTRYGDVTSYCWYGDGYIMLGFEAGHLVCISTHSSEIGQEIFSIQDHKSYLSHVTVSKEFDKAISTGDNCVKIRELSQMSQVYAIVELDSEDKGLEKVAVSADGQLMAVAGRSGSLHLYLTRLPVLGDCYLTKIAVLTSLTEITVYNDVEQDPPVTFVVEIEPTFLGVGPVHVVVGMNNRAWFYVLTRHGAELIRDFEYLGSVQCLRLNGVYAAALFEGRVQLHRIEEGNVAEGEEVGRIFPDSDKNAFKITSISLTTDFLIIATDGGHLQYFFLEDWKYVNEFRHSVGIRSIFPETSGTRLCLIDDKRDVFVYSPVNDSLISISQSSVDGAVRGILWENWPTDKDIFALYDQNKLTTYVYSRDSLEGSQLIMAGTTKLPYGHIPMMLYNGEVTCQTQSGRTGHVHLDTHKFDISFEGKTESEYRKEKSGWERLGKAAMENMDIELAIRVFRQMGDVGMVWSLEDLGSCEDKYLLAGHLAMFMQKFDLAEKLYLESSVPIEALEMRRDLLHWDKALQLANRLAPNQIPYISKEYAQQLEFTGDHSNALIHFEKGTIDNDESAKAHNEICQAGIARASIRTGDINRGLQIAEEAPSRALKKECALILEQMKQYNDAAKLFEKGHFFDRAAAVCIKAKNWMKVGELLPNVHSPKIHSQYAKAMEAEKKYKQAAEAYRNAKDYDNLVRVLLEYLNSPEEAVKVVRESKSIEGAKLVSKFFLRIGDHSSAIQFLVISQCTQEAFRLAEEHGKMEIYAQVIGDDGTQEDYESIAAHFEKQRKPYLAGKFYYHAGQYAKSLGLLLSNGEDHESLKLAITCVGKANDPNLTRKLTDFLMGEVDGVPKDAKYLFRLYVALKMHREAAKTAIIIAREEQNNGQYRVAHDVLFGMYQELNAQNIRMPAEMESNLMLIHSYLIVKSLVRRGDHGKAARMLIRVANSISRFPSHIVEILTSAVIECSKVGLKSSAFNFAAQLMRTEYRKKIGEKYRKKIEAIVRKADKAEDPEESQSACLFCENQLPDTELSCSKCKNSLPYCIVTGRHMVKDDFSCCPKCQFPAILVELKRSVEANEPCPMCAQKISVSDLAQLTDLSAYLMKPEPMTTKS